MAKGHARSSEIPFRDHCGPRAFDNRISLTFPKPLPSRRSISIGIASWKSIALPAHAHDFDIHPRKSPGGRRNGSNCTGCEPESRIRPASAATAAQESSEEGKGKSQGYTSLRLLQAVSRFALLLHQILDPEEMSYPFAVFLEYWSETSKVPDAVTRALLDAERPPVVHTNLIVTRLFLFI